jgi:peptidoglycan/LPS O-acetylase OafA/YrhL
MREIEALQKSASTSDLGERIAGIDALRGIAALGVAAFHIYSQNLTLDARADFPVAAHFLIMWGRWGVQLFFVISGFVIAYTLHDRKNFDRIIDLPLYFVRRMVRLDTLYFIVLCMYVGVKIFAVGWADVPQIEFSVLTVMKNIVYFFPIHASLWIPVAWTLSIEVQFYVAMAAFFILLNMNGLKQHAALLTTVAAFLSLAYPLRLIDLEIGFWLLPSLFNLLAGSLVYFLVFHQTRFIVAANAVYAIALAAIYLVMKESHILATLMGYFAVFSGLSLLPTRIVGHPAVLFLGARSYGIYLVHQLLGFVLVTHLVGFPIHSCGPVLLAIGLLGTTVAAHALYVLVERPSINLSRKIGRKPRTMQQRAGISASLISN